MSQTESLHSTHHSGAILARHQFVSLLSRLLAGGLICTLYGNWLWGNLLSEIIPLELAALCISYAIVPSLLRNSDRSLQEVWVEESAARLTLLLLSMIALLALPAGWNLSFARMGFLFIVTLSHLYLPVRMLQREDTSSILRPLISPLLLGFFFLFNHGQMSLAGILSLLALGEAIGTMMIAGKQHRQFPLIVMPVFNFTSFRNGFKSFLAEVMQFLNQQGDVLIAFFLLSNMGLAIYQLTSIFLALLQVAGLVGYHLLHTGDNVRANNPKAMVYKMLLMGGILIPIASILFLQFLQEQSHLEGSFFVWVIVALAQLTTWCSIPHYKAMQHYQEEALLARIQLTVMLLMLLILPYTFVNYTPFIAIAAMSSLQLLRAAAIILAGKRIV